MGEITKATGFRALSEKRQLEHRMSVGIWATAILETFWVDRNDDDPTRRAIEATQIETWVDCLMVYPMDEIKAAYRAYGRDKKSWTKAGALRRPQPFSIEAKIIALRKAATPKPKVEPVARIEEAPRVRVSTEAADQIVSELGFGGVSAPKRMTQPNGENDL